VKRRVLIVTSTYAPAMMADMHRARLLAWELPRLGWEVEILCPDTGFQVPETVDPDAAAFFSPETTVHRAPRRHARLYGLLGLGSIGWRALASMNRTASRLFSNRRIDLVYFSTTQFNLFLLGWYWRSRFGVPYVLDFHDPCFKPEPGFAGGTPAGLKRSFNTRLHRLIEAVTTRCAAGLVSVSPTYIESMHERYEGQDPVWLRPDRHAVIPFAASERDLAEASSAAKRDASDPALRRIIYVGAGGPVMMRAFGVICRALAELKSTQSPLLHGMRIELYGTMLRWRPGDRKHLLEVAHEHGVEDLVQEDPGRVSYRRSLELLVGGDGALILGVDDKGYMPSKLFTYALSGKPLLAALNEESPAYRAFKERPALGHAIGFGSGDAADQAAPAIVESFLREVASGSRFDRLAALQPDLSASMAGRHAALFEACLTNPQRDTGT